jgi:membrane protease YdiL (CAAX protease family)
MLTRPIVAFVILAYAQSLAIGVIVGLTGGPRSPFIGLGFAAMLAPALAAFVVSRWLGEPPRINWSRFPLVWLPAALLLIPSAMHAAMLSRVAVGGPLPWVAWLTPQPDGLYHAPASLGWGTMTPNGLLARIAVNAVVGLVVVSFFALFEEIGWRGWLLPRLADRMGPRRAVVATSAIWAIWHVPFGLSGIHHIEGISPLQITFLMPLGIFAAGLVIGWLWVRTESIWIVAFAHGATNHWGQFAFKFMREFAIPLQIQALLAGSLALLAVGALLLFYDAPLEPQGRRSATRP